MSLATLTRKGEVASVAVKTMLDNGVPAMELRQFEYEARLLTALTHPNIVKVVAVCFQQSPFMICLELMSGGDLRSYLKEHEAELRQDSEPLLSACLQIANAMAYLEQHRVVHRDLAARFVL